MDWDALRIFLAVKRTGSLRAAAERLCVSHATVSRGLSSLEKALGTRLFDRTRSGLTLTMPGEQLVEPAERIEIETLGIEHLIAGQDSKPKGLVRVSVPPVIAFHYITRFLADFSDAYPEIDVDVNISNTFLNLQRLETDVSIRISREVEDDVVGRRLIQYKKGVYANPSYLAARAPLVIGDGSGANWIGWSDEGKRPAWVANSPFPKAKLRHIVPEATMQAEAASLGMGLTYLPCFIGDQWPNLVRVPGVDPFLDRSIWLLLHNDLRKTARVRAFVDFMAEAILKDRKLLLGEID